MRGEVLKNHLELLVLTALKAGPGHGYSIIRAIRDRSDGEFELLEGSLYPALHRLERDRLVDQQLVERGRAQAPRLQAEPEGPRRARTARARLAPLRARDEPRPRRSMTISDYMAELERELRRRRAPRARLLRETEDHLHDLCAELAAGGLAHEQAEARAVAQFGAAATIAARFAEATASTTAHRAVTVTAAAFVAYTGVFVAFATAASPLLRDFPQGAGSFLALQLAAVALGVAFVRSLRWRGAPAAPTAELTAIARALSVAGVVLIGAAVAEAAVAVSRPAGVIAWSDGRWLTLAFAAALAVLLLAAIAAVRGRRPGARRPRTAGSDT